jgi:hypothetical protein
VASFDTNAPLAKSLEHVRLLHTLQTVELEVTNNGQLFDFENDVYAASRTVFSQNASGGFVEKGQRQERLVITLDRRLVVRITGSDLDVIKDVVLAQATVADDVDVFDDSLLGLRLLGCYASRSYENCSDTNQ